MQLVMMGATGGKDKTFPRGGFHRYNMGTTFVVDFTPMHCPFCGSQDTRVSDSRLVAGGDQVRRRRQCAACRERFTTYETAELIMPRVVKADGSRATFDESKLRAGMLRALEKRPVSAEAIEAAVERIRQRLRARGEREVEAREIGEEVMRALRRLDQIAYIRFASVYRRFQDVDEFRTEIDRLTQEPGGSHNDD